MDRMPVQAVVPLAVRRTDELDAADVVSMLRRQGFDLRRRMFSAYVVDFGARREDACSAAQSVRNTEWDSALYGDASGWVLRLSRTRRLTPESVHEDVAEVRLLAGQSHGQVRGVTVEDLRQDDVWAEMASQLQGGSRRRSDQSATAAVPQPRQDLPARVDL
jgi:hypothetical protein